MPGQPACLKAIKSKKLSSEPALGLVFQVWPGAVSVTRGTDSHLGSGSCFTFVLQLVTSLWEAVRKPIGDGRDCIQSPGERPLWPLPVTPSYSGHELSCSTWPLRPSFQMSVKHLSLDSQASRWLSLKTASACICTPAPPVWPRPITAAGGGGWTPVQGVHTEWTRRVRVLDTGALMAILGGPCPGLTHILWFLLQGQVNRLTHSHNHSKLKPSKLCCLPQAWVGQRRQCGLF